MKLTAEIALRYKLKDHPKADDGYLIKAGQSIHINKAALTFFHACDLGGRPTTKFTVTES